MSGSAAWAGAATRATGSAPAAAAATLTDGAFVVSAFIATAARVVRSTAGRGAVNATAAATREASTTHFMVVRL